jgi:hypothetical protein
MSVRAIAGIVLGIVLWWALFFVLSFQIVTLWPGSESYGKALFEGDYSVLPTGALMVLLLMFVGIGLVAGWVTAWITRKEVHAWVVAVPIFLFAVFQHLYVLWGNLPDWYNLAVVVLIWPFIILGARLRKPAASQLNRV